MYKIRSVHNLANGKAPRLASAEELIEAVSAAQSSLQEFQTNIGFLIEMARYGSSKVPGDFSVRLKKCLSSISGASYGNEPLFNGSLDVDVFFSGAGGETVRVWIADLIGKFEKYHSNYSEVTTCDVTDFARRIRSCAAARTSPEASIQGVRLDTFLQRSVKSSRLLAINSLAGLTGLHAMSYGNAMSANVESCDTGMPLADGCFSVNGVAIPASDGTVASLVSQINRSRDQHGVHAHSEAGQVMVLLNYSGERIELKIANQCGALLSGFPSGITEVNARSNGLVAWVSFRRLHEVRYDSSNTARLVSGSDADSVALKSALTANLSLDSLADRRLALSVLLVMNNIVIREHGTLASSLAGLQELLAKAAARQTRRNLATRADRPSGLGAGSQKA